MLSVILINVLTIALLSFLHVQREPIHHLRDPHPHLWHVLRITPVSCVHIRYKISENANQSVSKRGDYVLFVWALIKFIGIPTSLIIYAMQYIISHNVCYITNLPFSFVTRGPPESPKHIIPFSCPVTLPNAHKCSFCTL